MSQIPPEFEKRIYQVFNIYERARFVALTKILFGLIASIAGILISLRTIEQFIYKALVFGVLLVYSGAFIKSQHKHMQLSRVYKHRVNNYLSIYSLEFNGQTVNLK